MMRFDQVIELNFGLVAVIISIVDRYKRREEVQRKRQSVKLQPIDQQPRNVVSAD